MSTQDYAILEFERYYGRRPSFVVRAPGRVNLIGEHTDYNDGFVLPIAIDRAVWIALRPTATRRVILHSLNLKQSAEFSLDNIKHENQEWVAYFKGVAWALQQAGFIIEGWEGLITSDIPIGAGLSSSAALELATARAFAAVSNFPWEAIKMAQIGQQAERDWVGVNCGIMDQMISAVGKAGRALLIDCRSLKTEFVPLPADIKIVVLDTATRRGLVDSAYNERRGQCKIAARFFGVPALRDVFQPDFDAKAEALDPVVFRRARHVISENIRTLQAVNATRCINRFCCVSACIADQKNFLGPNAMLASIVRMLDPREKEKKERLKILYSDQGLYRCHSSQACSFVCPKEIDVAHFMALAKEGDQLIEADLQKHF